MSFALLASIGAGVAGADSPTPTATGARSSISRPTSTPDTRAPAVQTMDAFRNSAAATIEARPTATPGPSRITLSGKPHFIDFYATWCGPCISMKPALKRIEQKYGEQVTFWEIDIDNIGSTRLVRQYRVLFIPYLVLLDADGKVFEILEGEQSERQLDAAIQRLLRARSS
jgi:thiol-disulfide isomerase/thioredoxin